MSHDIEYSPEEVAQMQHERFKLYWTFDKIGAAHACSHTVVQRILYGYRPREHHRIPGPKIKKYNLVTKFCVHCGESFEGMPNRLYCSRPCADREKYERNRSVATSLAGKKLPLPIRIEWVRGTLYKTMRGKSYPYPSKWHALPVYLDGRSASVLCGHVQIVPEERISVLTKSHSVCGDCRKIAQKLRHRASCEAKIEKSQQRTIQELRGESDDQAVRMRQPLRRKGQRGHHGEHVVHAGAPGLPLRG
jgi:hypothetical protein